MLRHCFYVHSKGFQKPTHVSYTTSMVLLKGMRHRFTTVFSSKSLKVNYKYYKVKVSDGRLMMCFDVNGSFDCNRQSLRELLKVNTFTDICGGQSDQMTNMPSVQWNSIC